MRAGSKTVNRIMPQFTLRQLLIEIALIACFVGFLPFYSPHDTVHILRTIVMSTLVGAFLGGLVGGRFWFGALIGGLSMAVTMLAMWAVISVR